MAKERIKRTLSLLLVIGMCAVIFRLSAQNGEQSSGLSDKVTMLLLTLFLPGYRDMTIAAQQACVVKWSFFVRKTAHFSEYALLAATAVNYLRFAKPGSKGHAVFPIALTFAAIYAVTDELHQMFVGGRAAMIADICIDASGALVGALAAVLFFRLTGKI